VIATDGEAITDLTPDFDERIGGGNTNSGPTWSGDGRWVLFVSCRRTNVGLFRASLSERRVEPVPPATGVSDAVSSDSSGRVLAWVHEDATHPAEVWLLDAAQGAPRAFTDLNPWTRERPAFPADVVTWPGADGHEVEGLLYRPRSLRAGVRVPLLLYVHGGPSANHAEYFTPSLDMQGLAHYLQTGWAVLLPNPSGSAGYGLAWRKANQRDWADRPYVDLMTGVDALIARGLVDSTRLAVCGWSYGGYMTANIVGRTDRFRAAVAGAGPVNLTSMTGTCDVPGLLQHAMQAWPWEDPAVYEANSPLARVTHVRTPTAFVHGGADPRVPPSQSWEMFRALRTLEVPTDLMILPRSLHAPEEPRQLRTFMEWNHAWLARWTLAPFAKASPGRTPMR
jgi:dipeptidyl aminopeptidase/acylaminoacyl peptidase